MNNVHDDYRNRRLDAYFLKSFVDRHLKFRPIPIGSHKEARELVRSGNVTLNERQQDGHRAGVNSLLFDINLDTNESQIQSLMKEVESRNTGGFYSRNADPRGLFVSDHMYYVHTTLLGSRHSLVLGRLRYGVFSLGDRYVINHYDDVIG